MIRRRALIAGIGGSPVVNRVVLQSGREVPADLVSLSIGVRPELTLAREAVTQPSLRLPANRRNSSHSSRQS